MMRTYRIEIHIDEHTNGYSVMAIIFDKTTNRESSFCLVHPTHVDKIEQVGEILSKSLAASSLAR